MEGADLQDLVMPGLDPPAGPKPLRRGEGPGIHRSSIESLILGWMAGSSPAMTTEKLSINSSPASVRHAPANFPHHDLSLRTGCDRRHPDPAADARQP